MKHKKTIIGITLMTLLTSHTYASMKVEQFCFGDTVVKNAKLMESNVITVNSIDKPVAVEILGRDTR